MVPCTGTTRLGRLSVAITASEARKRLFPLLAQVNDDRVPIEIVSRHGDAVLISREEYEALEETAHLMRSPANARRLLDAYEDAVAGRNLREVDPAELDALTSES